MINSFLSNAGMYVSYKYPEYMCTCHALKNYLKIYANVDRNLFVRKRPRTQMLILVPTIIHNILI